MQRINWEKTASVTITLIGGGFLLYLLCRFLFGLFMPFLLAFLLAALTRPLIRFLSRKTGWSMRVCAVLGVLFFLTVLGVILYLLFLRLFSELQRLLDFLIEDSAREDGNIARMFRFFREWSTRVPFLSRLRELDFIKEVLGDPSEYFTAQLQNMLAELASKLTGAAGALLTRLPGVLFFLVVTLIACFYFALEYDSVCSVFERLFPQNIRTRLPEWKQRFTAALKRCAKAYLLLFLLTFAELFIGLLLLKAEYPFLLALLTALLDVLPVLGVGTVLVPWAIFALLTGSTARGIWLLVLFAVITTVRQFAEPHLVGKSIGLHPIPMLIAFYVGLSLFGIAGILIGPMLALLCKLLFERVNRPEKI